MVQRVWVNPFSPSFNLSTTILSYGQREYRAFFHYLSLIHSAKSDYPTEALVFPPVSSCLSISKSLQIPTPPTVHPAKIYHAAPQYHLRHSFTFPRFQARCTPYKPRQSPCLHWPVLHLAPDILEPIRHHVLNTQHTLHRSARPSITTLQYRSAIIHAYTSTRQASQPDHHGGRQWEIDD